MFAIDPMTVEVTVAQPDRLDFERVQAFEPRSPSPTASPYRHVVGTITVPVLDVNEAPEIESASFELPANASLGAFVGEVVFSDPT